MDQFCLSHFVGVFDPRMERIYRRMGVEPDVVGSAGAGKGRISVGLWEMKPAAWDGVLAQVGVSRAASRDWLAASFMGRGAIECKEPEKV